MAELPPRLQVGAHVSVVLITVLCFLKPDAANGQNCAPRDSRFSTSQAPAIVLNTGQGVPVSAASQAVSRWETSCPGSGGEYPDLGVNQSISGAITVTVNLFIGQAPNGCGNVSIQPNSAGQVVGAMISIYTTSSEGFTCNQPDAIAHELGHVLGLGNAGSLSCAGTIMGSSFPDGAGGLQSRTIGQDACTTAGDFWITPYETGSGGQCNASCGPCSL